MKRLGLCVAAVVAATSLALSCGATEGDGSGSTAGSPATGSGGDGGNASSDAGQSASPCDASNAFPIWGKLYDPDRDCIDTETHLDSIACTLQPAPDASPDERNYSDRFSCLRRLSDGQEFWVFAYNRLGFDASLWERCPNEPVRVPKGCYAAGCTEAPRSSCSLEETRKQFDCTATGEYDENCCGRQPCESSDDCGADEQCLQVSSLGQWYCWDNPGNTCDCGGPLGAPLKMLCMPN